MEFVMNRPLIFVSLLLLGAAFTVGCETGQQGITKSPARAATSSAPNDLEGFIQKVKRTNEEARDREMREQNVEAVRAFNRETGKYEYVPLDSLQYWNEKEKRWEFTPRELPKQ